MQVHSVFKPALVGMPPLYQWPHFLKRVVLVSATIFCLSIYALLAFGMIGSMILMLNLLTGS